MPTIITHAVAGAAIAQVLAPCSIRAQVTWIAAGCAMLPDVDGIGLRLGIPYDSLFGHRGITHSLLFAGLVVAVVTSLLRKKVHGGEVLRVLVCIFAATASHGILDAFTNGGLGVAFFSPFDQTRYFFSARPILVSPMYAGAFLTERGVSVLRSEMVWVWAPSTVVFLVARFARCR